MTDCLIFLNLNIKREDVQIQNQWQQLFRKNRTTFEA